MRCRRLFCFFIKPPSTTFHPSISPFNTHTHTQRVRAVLDAGDQATARQELRALDVACVAALATHRGASDALVAAAAGGVAAVERAARAALAAAGEDLRQDRARLAGELVAGTAAAVVRRQVAEAGLAALVWSQQQQQTAGPPAQLTTTTSLADLRLMTASRAASRVQDQSRLAQAAAELALTRAPGVRALVADAAQAAACLAAAASAAASRRAAHTAALAATTASLRAATGRDVDRATTLRARRESLVAKAGRTAGAVGRLRGVEEEAVEGVVGAATASEAALPWSRVP